MKNKVLKVHPSDNIIVALQDFAAGDEVVFNGRTYQLPENIPTKHKFAERDFAEGETIIMYGVTVGKALRSIPVGSRISRENVVHATLDFGVQISDFGGGDRNPKSEIRNPKWTPPDISKFQNRTFNGYHRADGKAGARNYWLVVPLVFCENRNIKVMQEAMLEQLGYATGRDFSVNIGGLIERYRAGAAADEILQTGIIKTGADIQRNRLFPNVDGIKFLTHDGGCGGTRQDSETLCRLLAGVLDYTEQVTRAGLNLLCTPGNDVESTTGLASSGANLIVFTTGLGTPTGNPVAPTVKMSTNNALAQRMPDLIDINAGTVISGEDTIETKGEELLIRVASGERLTHAERLGQDDFIPWKRGVSL